MPSMSRIDGSYYGIAPQVLQPSKIKHNLHFSRPPISKGSVPKDLIRSPIIKFFKKVDINANIILGRASSVRCQPRICIHCKVAFALTTSTQKTVLILCL